MKTFLNTIVIVILFIFIFSLWGFYWAIRPIKLTSEMTPGHFGIFYEDVSFYTQDHILIRGWFIPNTNKNAKTIILLHGYPADKGNILPIMIFLHKKYNLLFFDFRYLGKSEGRYSTIGKNEVLDLLAAIQYLHSRGIQNVGVWGFSLGGAVALMTAQKTADIKAIVAESSYARLDWMANEYYPIPLLQYPLGLLSRFWAWLFLHYDIQAISPANAVENLHIPMLLTHSKEDNVISFRHALLLQQSLRHNPNATFIFYEKGKHGEIVHDHEILIQNFFDKNL